MCDVSTALMATNATLGLVSGVAKANTIRQQGRAQADALERNAEIAQQQGHDAILRGGTDEYRLRRGVAQMMANNRTQAAASGIDIDSGSLRNVQNATIREGEADAETIRFNAARERWGYMQQAANLQSQANYSRASSKYQANNLLAGNALKFGISLGTGLADYENNRDESSLTDTLGDDRSLYWDWLEPYGIKKKHIITSTLWDQQ